jgi:hypothetical protein
MAHAVPLPIRAAWGGARRQPRRALVCVASCAYPHRGRQLEASTELVNVALEHLGSEAEVGELSIFTSIHQFGRHQLLEMVRDGGLRDACPLHQLRAADLPRGGNALEQTTALVVGQGLGDALEGVWGHVVYSCRRGG